MVAEPKKYRLYRAVYGYDGVDCIESNRTPMDDGMFEIKAAEPGADIRFIIGSVHLTSEHGDSDAVHIDVELEGSKRNLDIVLDAMNYCAGGDVYNIKNSLVMSIESDDDGKLIELGKGCEFKIDGQNHIIVYICK